MVTPGVVFVKDGKAKVAGKENKINGGLKC